MKFSKKNQKIVLIIILIIIVLSFFSVFKLLKSYFNNSREVIGVINEVTDTNTKIESEIKTQSSQIWPKALSGGVVQEDNVRKLSVSLTVLDKVYKGNVKEGGTVYDFMKNLESEKENNFSFSGEDHSGLGFFVKELNGVKGKMGKYWIYYVNDKEASVGVSNYILKNGDRVSWKQEAF